MFYLDSRIYAQAQREWRPGEPTKSTVEVRNKIVEWVSNHMAGKPAKEALCPLVEEAESLGIGSEIKPILEYCNL